jgi:hypothetical protein
MRATNAERYAQLGILEELDVADEGTGQLTDDVKPCVDPTDHYEEGIVTFRPTMEVEMECATRICHHY